MGSEISAKAETEQSSAPVLFSKKKIKRKKKKKAKTKQSFAPLKILIKFLLILFFNWINLFVHPFIPYSLSYL
jgi:hypothetical protein